MQTLLFLLPQLILFLAAVLVFGIDLVGSNKKKWLPYLALGGALASLAAALYLAMGAALPTEPFLGGMLAIDSFALFFQFFAALVAGVVIISSLGYIRDCTPYLAEFYSLLLLASISITLVAAATDLIMIYVAFELLSITSYILTGYLRDDPKSSEAAVKYFLYGAMASAAMLYGMSLLYGTTGSTNLSSVAGALAGAEASLQWVIFPAIVLLLVGFGFKIAAVPFHQWSPDAYEGAPTPVTAFLSVGPKAAGFAVLMRVLLVALPGFHTDWMALLSALSMMTMTLGNLVAISQKNIKRMLAYSSIAQAGYMLIGVASWDLWQSGSVFDGISGVMFYLLVYLFANLGAFSAVIAFERATGSNKIEDYAGLMQRSPVLASTMIVFLFSLVGIPGTGGFIGKFFIFGAAIRAEFYALVIVAIVTTVISAFYYLNVARYMFFESYSNEETHIKPSLALKIALVVNCVLVLVLGLYAQPFFQLVEKSLEFLHTL
ncbi:MAG: NADH-quinone oxidoreductase subunit N [Chloroflexi bacterium]|nr:NADH-quinone oxidoreductase subunit N [Chloroflexota bacterium]